MKTKIVTALKSTQKRTLRSSNKTENQDNLAVTSSSEQKVNQDIQKIFENQQSLNISKSTDLIYEDHKLPINPIELNQQTENFKQKLLSTKSKNLKVDCNIQTKKLSLSQQFPIINAFKIDSQSRQSPPPKQVVIFETPAKQKIEANKKEQSDALKETRKSYRKSKRSIISQVPYRKFQDPFEQKIVILINKILQNKINQKDLMNFGDRVSRTSSKEFYNPYIVSGIKTVVDILQKSQIFQNCLQKLKAELKKLQNKISIEFSKTQDYYNLKEQKIQTNYESFKPKFTKKIYRFLQKTKKYEQKQAKQKSIFLCEQFFSRFENFKKEDQLINFFRQRKILQN